MVKTHNVFSTIAFFTSIARYALSTFAAIIPFLSLEATTYTVNVNTDTDPTGQGSGSGTTGDLRWVLNQINIDTTGSTAATSDIVFSIPATSTITLGGLLPIVNLTNTNTATTVDINSTNNPITIDGSNLYPGFFLHQGNVTINDIAFHNTKAIGGDGHSGALGAGGALFINSANTTISNIDVFTSNATGGNAFPSSSFYIGGAGMYQGSGSTAGGGGGMGGAGIVGGGGIGNPAAGTGPGSAAGGTIGDNGASGLGFGIGGGGNSTNCGTDGGADAGGGATACVSFGAGGGGANGASTTTDSGGNGGFGGGGGLHALAPTTTTYTSGDGGFGGGGASYSAPASPTSTVSAGSGGFGGGGGRGTNTGADGGKGGFGASGGVATSSSNAPGASGVGGGLVNSTGVIGASGGAGFGGAIFVNTSTDSSYYNSSSGGGGTLTIAGSFTASNATITAGLGSGASDTNAGTAAGNQFFLTSLNSNNIPLTFQPPSNTSITLYSSNAIADDSAYSLPGGTYQGGSAAGAKIVMNGPGTLIFDISNTNAFSGGIDLGGGIFQVNNTSSLGNPASYITFTNSATLQFGTAIDISNPIDLSNGTATFDTNGLSSTCTLSGDISGNGSFLSTGGGILNLTGTNSYLGGTTNDSNTTLTGSTSSLQGNIINNGTLDFEEPAASSGTYLGIISGTGDTVINGFGGTGTVTFDAVQTYTGATRIADGTLELFGSGNLNPVTNVDIGTSATFDISGATSAVTIADLTGSGFIYLGSSSSLTVDTANSTTYGGDIQGSGSASFAKEGSGTLILTGISSISGDVDILAGTLQLSQANNLTTNITNNATLDIEAPASTAYTFAGNISGTGNLVINGDGGTGTVNLNDLFTYAGPTTITNGTLAISQTGDATMPGDITINGGATLDLDQAGSTTGTYSGDISGAGNVNINQLGDIGTIVFSGGKSYTGPTHVYNGTLKILNSSDVTQSGAFIIDSGSTVDFEQTASTIGHYYQGISGGGGVEINKNSNNGTVVFSNSATYTGPTTVYDGLLALMHTSTSTISTPITIYAPGTVDFEQSGSTIGTYSGGISGDGNIYINQSGNIGTVFFDGPQSFTGTATVFNGIFAGTPTTLPPTIDVSTTGLVDIEQASGTGTHTGIIQDIPGEQGALAINRFGGTGRVNLVGSYTITGGTTVYNGIFQLAPSTLIGSIAVNTNALVDIEQASGSDTFAGTIVNGINQIGSVAINQQGGTGTVIFNGPQYYTGLTTIYNGTLETEPQNIVSNIAINSGATLDFEETTNNSGTNSSNISGDGALVVNASAGNTNTVILKGFNSYKGGTLIAGGTLQGDTNSLQGAITDNSALIFDQQVDGTFNGSLLGAGNVAISGSGKVNYTTNSPSFTGQTNIDGILSLNAILGGNLNVNSGGRLQGTGTLLGNMTVENNGAIVPGNSIGTLTVNGNYTQQGEGILTVQVAGMQNSSLNVLGKGRLNKGSILNIDSNSQPVTINFLYPILTTSGGLSGTFTTIQRKSSKITPSVFYTSNNAYLLFSFNTVPIAQTYNQKQVANQLNTLTPSSPAALNRILTRLALLPPTQVDLALSQMSGTPYTTLILTSELANHQFLRRLFDPLRPILTSNPCIPKPNNTCLQPYDIWASISGGRTFIHGNPNANSFHLTDYEITAGAQMTLVPWRITGGAALSYEHDTTSFDVVGGRGTANTFLAGVYALYRPERFYVIGEGAFGFSQNKIHRVINVGPLHYNPSSHPKTYRGSIYAELGTDYGFFGLLLQPFLGIEAAYYHANHRTEKQGYPLELSLHCKSRGFAYSRLGVHITTPPVRNKFWPNNFWIGVDLAWAWRLTSLANNLNVHFQEFGTQFKIRGVSFNRNNYEATIRLNQILLNHWTVYLNSTFQGSHHFCTYNLVCGITTSW